MYNNLAYVLLAATVLPFAFGTASAQDDGRSYEVQPGDMLQVAVWGEEELQGTALVTPDGMFSFPLVGHLSARGKTAAELQELVRTRLEKYFSDPVVTVSIQQVVGNKIYIIGAVNNPGAFVMNHKINVMQALSMAGGTTPFASLNDIKILRRTADGQVALGFRYSDVAKGRDLDQNVELVSGDIVVVP
ncbi:MAG: polysaccharide biosynthesis/export family protein [Proteobacteria bacterium]|nr:polysaccharide biosynthesis/export family protein [Pseudomonadota bacterium]